MLCKKIRNTAALVESLHHQNVVAHADKKLILQKETMEEQNKALIEFILRNSFVDHFMSALDLVDGKLAVFIKHTAFPERFNHDLRNIKLHSQNGNIYFLYYHHFNLKFDTLLSCK